MTGIGGNAPKVSATHTVAVYDTTDGRVVHMHHVVVFEGGKPISAEQAQKEAVEHVKRRGHDIGKLRTLLAESGVAARGGRYRVDITSQKMIALDPPARRRVK